VKEGIIKNMPRKPPLPEKKQAPDGASKKSRANLLHRLGVKQQQMNMIEKKDDFVVSVIQN